MRRIPYTSLLLLIAVVLVAASCDDPKTNGNDSVETAISGTAEVLCDELILDLMAPSKRLYDSVHPKAHVTLKPIDGEQGLNTLLRREARAIVIARDWLPSEDSAIKDHDLTDAYPRTLIARDALVFYAPKSFPYDTMYAGHLAQYIKTGVFDKASYPLLKKAPVFVVPGSTSSIYGNVINVVCKGTIPAKGVISSGGTMDSTLNLVRASTQIVGIGYLSQLRNDTTVKLLRLSYADSSGTYQTPKPVHAAYLIMGKYPFPVPIYVILRDKPNQYNLPSGYMLYLARDGKAQRTFFDAGIEPGYAKIELILPED